MNYLAVIILYSIYLFSGERSLNAVFYLLTGKKSSQTIQDACWYNLYKLFQAYSSLSISEFHEQIKMLQHEGYIIQGSKTVQITNEGKKFLDEQLKQCPIPNELNGWKYSGIDNQFWERLNLSAQIISNLLNNESSYFPVQRNIVLQKWMKYWLKKTLSTFSRRELSLQLYKELNLLLKSNELSIDPIIFVYRLSGYKLPGLTNKQISSYLQIDEAYSSLAFRSIIHYMLSTIWKDKRSFPLLNSLADEIQRSPVLTQSTLETYTLLGKGLSVNEIVNIRRLKKSTIEDHLIEIALMVPTFSMDPYVHKDIQRKIIEVARTLNTRRLKRIKEAIPEADYFEIRLVLSKMNFIED